MIPRRSPVQIQAKSRYQRSDEEAGHRRSGLGARENVEWSCKVGGGGGQVIEDRTCNPQPASGSLLQEATEMETDSRLTATVVSLDMMKMEIETKSQAKREHVCEEVDCSIAEAWKRAHDTLLSRVSSSSQPAHDPHTRVVIGDRSQC